MPYVTLQGLVDRFGEQELQQLAPTETDAIDPVKVQAACDDAAGEIDSYLAAGGYATPITPTPGIVAAYGADIARYRLHDDDAPEIVTKRYERAIKFLQAVASGQVKLGGGSVGSEPDEPLGSADFVPGRKPVFPGGSF